jgi:hypothetical protein
VTHSGSTFYCRNCADKLGLLSDLQPVTTAPSTYQIDKALKHTRPTALTTGIHSVLNSGSTADHQAFEQRTLDRGFVEFEESGKRALILQTTGNIGTVYQGGACAGAADSFPPCSVYGHCSGSRISSVTYPLCWLPMRPVLDAANPLDVAPRSPQVKRAGSRLASRSRCALASAS